MRKYLREGFDDSFDDNEVDFTDVADSNDADDKNTRFNKIKTWVDTCLVVEPGKDSTGKNQAGFSTVDPNTLMITVYGNAFISRMAGMTNPKCRISTPNGHKLPPYIKFGKVYGDFTCKDLDLTSLNGMPEIVYGTFNCNHNNLYSLEGGPKEVMHDYYCESCNLETLLGCPKQVRNRFDCAHNNISSLKYLPEDMYELKINHNNITEVDGSCRYVNTVITYDNPIQLPGGLIQEQLRNNYLHFRMGLKNRSIQESFDNSFDDSEEDYADIFDNEDRIGSKLRKLQLMNLIGGTCCYLGTCLNSTERHDYVTARIPGNKKPILKGIGSSDCIAITPIDVEYGSSEKEWKNSKGGINYDYGICIAEGNRVHPSFRFLVSDTEFKDNLDEYNRTFIMPRQIVEEVPMCIVDDIFGSLLNTAIDKFCKADYNVGQKPINISNVPAYSNAYSNFIRGGNAVYNFNNRTNTVQYPGNDMTESLQIMINHYTQDGTVGNGKTGIKNKVS